MGPEVPSVSNNVGIPEAPQIRPRGLVMVLEPGLKLGLGLRLRPLSRAN